ncbi:MAG: bifunctional oligoribonuclease/PAP phosphatase NrnA [Candidatus Omnitrophica bacterium]|nr:bifunctional oligoribonuclease/PAP phosphatase NrnA [Candidatus Omnitrophota bacterium]
MDTEKILKTIAQNKTFLVTTHVNPDPDALASQLVIAMYLKALGKKVFAVNEEHVPRRFCFLPGVKMIKKVDLKKRVKCDVAIVLDCGDFDRIGKVAEALDEKTTCLNIDHHFTNTLFGDVNMVNPNASSTAEVVFGLLQRAKFSLTKNMAILLYLGIMADTGCFRYANTTAHTHKVVSRLLQFGFSVSDLYRKLYESISLQDLQYFTKVANTFRSFCKGKVLCLELRKRVLAKFSDEFDLRDKIFRYLRAIKEVEVIVIITEESKNKTRVNLRSQGEVNVGKLACQFNGGGHKRASGCTIEGDIATAKRKILAKIRQDL